MAASLNEVNEWIKIAKKNNMKYIISVCDTYDWDDYPVYCKDKNQVNEERIKYDGVNMQKINEVINVDEEFEKIKNT